MRYVYLMTSALILGGSAIALSNQHPAGAQTAQNDQQVMAAAAPAGAPVSFADLATRLQPAVVNISTNQTVTVSGNPFAGTPFEDFFGRRGGNQPQTREAQSLGSGFIISADGYIVTNNHVVAPGARGAVVDSITVTLPDRTEYKAKLIGRDQASDLALLKIDAKNLPFVRFGDSTRTRVGDWVIAIGNPFGLGGTVTAGIVSALHRNTGQGGAYDRYIQTDASINSGNSGGPMFDLNGNVIGINSAIFSPTGGNVGIGFAIPAEQASPVIEALKRGDTVQRGYLGVQIQQIDDSIADSLGIAKGRGELIAGVEPGQGADKAGIKRGDIILKVAGREVTPDETLSYIVANSKPGTRIPIELLRDGKPMKLTVTVGQRPPEEELAAALGQDGDAMAPETPESGDAAARDTLGLVVQPLTPRIAQQLNLPDELQGVVISSVDPTSDAGRQGLQRGDVILSINQRPVTTSEDADAAVSAARAAGRPSVLLLVQRGRTPARYVGVKLRKR